MPSVGNASVKFVIRSKAREDPADVLNRTESQKKLDADVEKNMDLKYGKVEGLGVNKTAMPKGFTKPLKAHTGSIGIIGILNIILEDSKSMIEQDVKDETSEQ